jgi:CBS domain-containing protein
MAVWSPATDPDFAGAFMYISAICTRSVVTCRRNASAQALAQLMREQHVGDVVVVDGPDGELTPVGVITDRDLVVEVMAAGVDPALLRAEDLLVGELVTAVDTELVDDAVWHLRGRGIRRLPVVDARGHLVGMLTADDIARGLVEALSEVARIAPGQVERERIKRGPITSAPTGRE